LPKKVPLPTAPKEKTLAETIDKRFENNYSELFEGVESG
jgi:hypothetical protein